MNSDLVEKHPLSYLIQRIFSSFLSGDVLKCKSLESTNNFFVEVSVGYSQTHCNIFINFKGMDYGKDSNKKISSIGQLVKNKLIEEKATLKGIDQINDILISGKEEVQNNIRAWTIEIQYKSDCTNYKEDIASIENIGLSWVLLNPQLSIVIFSSSLSSFGDCIKMNYPTPKNIGERIQSQFKFESLYNGKASKLKSLQVDCYLGINSPISINGKRNYIQLLSYFNGCPSLNIDGPDEVMNQMKWNENFGIEVKTPLNFFQVNEKKITHMIQCNNREIQNLTFIFIINFKKTRANIDNEETSSIFNKACAMAMKELKAAKEEQSLSVKEQKKAEVVEFCIPEIARAISNIVKRSKNSNFQSLALEYLRVDSIDQVQSQLEGSLRDIASNLTLNEKRKMEELNESK